MAAARFRGPGSLFPRTRFPSEADGGSAGLLRGEGPIECCVVVFTKFKYMGMRIFRPCMRDGISGVRQRA